MPTKSFSSPTYKYVRTWERNGKGPKVPHAFSYSMAVLRSDKSEGMFTLSNGGAGTHLRAPDPSLQLALYRKLRAQAYASATLGADLGEGRKTLSSIASLLGAVRSPLKTIGAYMRKAAKRKNIGAGILKDSADAYLAFTYGVKPLMQSIFDVLEVINKPYPRVRTKATVRSKVDDPIYTANDYPKGPFAYVERIRHDFSMCGGFEIRVINPHLFSAEQLGLLNPLSVAWELVPFSFVVDWFVPIGVYVSSLSDYAGCSIVNPYTTSFTRTYGSRSRINQGRSAEDEAVRCTRTVGLPPELPKLTSLGIHWGQSRQHVANALALVTSMKLSGR